MRAASDALAPYWDELFLSSPSTQEAEAAGILPERAGLRANWEQVMRDVFAQALLDWPEATWSQGGGREGRHGEGLGHLLAEMQSVARAHPGATW
jgi:ring-1,2-phenylacetyl-CoA epoxidase subunit PaaC